MKNKMGMELSINRKRSSNFKEVKRVLQLCFFFFFSFSTGYAYPVVFIFSKQPGTNEFNLKWKRKYFSCYNSSSNVNKSEKGRLHIHSICWRRKYLNSCKPAMGYIVLDHNSHSSWLIFEFTVIFWVLSGKYLMSVFHFYTRNALLHHFPFLLHFFSQDGFFPLLSCKCKPNFSTGYWIVWRTMIFHFLSFRLKKIKKNYSDLS